MSNKKGVSVNYQSCLLAPFVQTDLGIGKYETQNVSHRPPTPVLVSVELERLFPNFRP